MLNYTSILLYLVTLLTLHESIFTMYSNVNDTLSRLFMNDFFVNSYYLLWTSFWYLPTFLLISFGIALVNSSKNGTGHVWLLIGLVFTVVSLHYQNLNLYNYLPDNCGANFNTLLSNSINKFHPALFYITLFHLLASSQLLMRQHQARYVLNSNLLKGALIGNLLTGVIIFTLFLGSWWALQEGSWGGWWNWDPSEVFGLFVMLYYLYTLHKFQKPNNYSILTSYLKILTQLVLVTYVFIQLNFDLVSHNFGTKVDQFIDTSQNFLILIVFLVVTVLLTFHYLLHRLNVIVSMSSCDTTYNRNPALIWHAAALLVIALILLSSFSLLINDFLWKLLSINIFNSTKFTYFYTSLLIIVILVRSWNLQLFLPLLFGYTAYFNKEVLLLTLIPVVTKNNLFHTSLISLLFVMLSESNQSMSFWEVLYENASYVQSHVSYDVGTSFISLNNFMIEQLHSILSNNESVESVWNFSWTSSSCEGHSFLHSITTNSVTQSLYAGNGLSNYMIDVLDFWISTSNLMLTLLLITMRYLLKTRKLITS